MRQVVDVHLARPAEQPERAPEIEVAVEAEDRSATPWRVILFNDELHTFEEVIVQLIKATHCTIPQAEAIAWRAHAQGKAVAYQGDFEDCFRVQHVLREIQLVTEIEG